MDILKNICIEIKDGDWIESKDQSQDGIRLIQTGNIGNGVYLEKKDKAKYISEETFEKLKCTEILTGDVLVSRLPSPVGRACLFPNINKRAITAVDCTIIRLDKNKCLPKYFVYYTMSDLYLRQINKFVVGTTRLRISRKNLENININLPSLEIQRKIVEVLDKAQELIDKRKEQIEALDELVKSKFVEMFGDPSKNEKRWEVTEIKKYLDVLTDYHSNGGYEALRDNVTLLDIPSYALMVRTTDLENNNFDKDVKYIDEHAYNYLEKSKVFGGEIIINKIGSAGKVYLMPYLNRPVSLAMNQFLLRFNQEKVNHIFLYNLLLTPYMESKIKEKVRGAVTKTITKVAVKEINIIVPPIELQNQFADFVKQVYKLKAKMEESLRELEDNFNSLMQRAFKGELFN